MVRNIVLRLEIITCIRLLHDIETINRAQFVASRRESFDKHEVSSFTCLYSKSQCPLSGNMQMLPLPLLRIIHMKHCARAESP